MSVFAGLSYFSLLLVVTWTFLISLSFTGNEWVHLQATVDIGSVMQSALGGGDASNNGRKKRDLKTTMDPWNYGTTSGSKYNQYGYTTPPMAVNGGGSNALGGMMDFLPSSVKDTVSTAQSSAQSVRFFLTVGFQQYCLKAEVEGSMEILKAMHASVCIDKEVLDHPSRYGLPKDSTDMLKKETEDIGNARICLQIAVFFTAVVVVLMLVKPVFLGSKFQVHYYWTLFVLALITMIVGASTLGFAQKEASSLKDQIDMLTSIMSASGQPSFVVIKTHVGTNIIYMSVAIVSIFLAILVNLGEMFYLRRSDSSVDYNTFSMRSQNA